MAIARPPRSAAPQSAQALARAPGIRRLAMGNCGVGRAGNSKLTSDDIQDMQEIFMALDAKKQGRINVYEVIRW